MQKSKWYKKLGINTDLYEFFEKKIISLQTLQKKDYIPKHCTSNIKETNQHSTYEQSFLNNSNQLDQQKVKQYKQGNCLSFPNTNFSKDGCNINTASDTVKNTVLMETCIANEYDISISDPQSFTNTQKLHHEYEVTNTIINKKLEQINTLNQLYEEIKNFNCDLKLSSINTVICDGNSKADVMIIGEAPGEKEDLQGIPFCGESGILLDSMFDAINFSRQKNMYITNSFFWRPPANRTPSNEEIESCKHFVEKHIELINPKIVVLVGATAMKSVLGGKRFQSISATRGKLIKYKNGYMKDNAFISIICIFHPAYLLRQPLKKKLAWIDLLKIKNVVSCIR